MKLIGAIKEKPAMYLGRKSITLLHSFIDGWHSRDPETVTDYNIMEFQRWIEKKYKITTTHSWSDIILFYSVNNESLAFDRFFEEFEKFINED